MRQVDTILARYPGPVTLYPSRLKMFGLFLTCVAFVLIAAFFLTVRPDDFDSLDALWMWLALLGFGAGAVVFAALMLPGAASLTLAADGFEVCSLFRRAPALWKDAGGFSVQDMREFVGDDSTFHESTFKDRMIVFEILSGGSGPERLGATKVDGMLPDNYRLPKDDLAWLMNEWRARALQKES